jgi:GNAT superfamily N-acetyltransferase
VTIVVRVAGAADLSRVLAVLADGSSAGDAEPSSLERETWTRMLDTSDLSVYLAEFGGVPVGTATLLVMPNLTYSCAPTGFIEAVHVAPRHRRAGVARAILRRVVDDARSQGCDKLQVVSHRRHADDGGHELYESIGFDAEAAGFRRYLRRTGDG